MRVAYVLKRFPRLSQTFVLDELLELERQGVEAVVVARRGSGEALEHDRVRDLHAPVHQLSPTASPHEAARLLHELGVDHVHAHFATWASEVAHVAAGSAGLPFSFTAHATDLYRDDVDVEALAQRVCAARFVVTVTDDNRGWLQRLLDERGLSGRVVRLYNGVDLARLPRDRGRREPDLLVAVGRLVEKKGFTDLLTALELLRRDGHPLRLVLVGEGPLRDELVSRTNELGLTDVVTMTGAQRQDDVLALVRRATALVVPSVVAADGDRDALPTVVLEAMALGTPVVATRVSGIPEMVEHGRSGLLVEQHEPRALADAVLAVAQDQELALRFTDAARASVEERFTLSSNVAVLRQLFAGAL